MQSKNYQDFLQKSSDTFVWGEKKPAIVFKLKNMKYISQGTGFEFHTPSIPEETGFIKKIL